MNKDTLRAIELIRDILGDNSERWWNKMERIKEIKQMFLANTLWWAYKIFRFEKIKNKYWDYAYKKSNK